MSRVACKTVAAKLDLNLQLKIEKPMQVYQTIRHYKKAEFFLFIIVHISIIINWSLIISLKIYVGAALKISTNKSTFQDTYNSSL